MPCFGEYHYLTDMYVVDNDAFKRSNIRWASTADYERVKKQNAQFDKDLETMNSKLKKRFEEQGYLTLGDMIEILHIKAECYNPYILYTGPVDKYRKDMIEAGMRFYRESRKSDDPNVRISSYKKFNQVNEALDELDGKSKED